jgi:hypothetical protein
MTRATSEINAKYMLEEYDGRLALAYRLTSGFDGTFELTEDNRTIIMKMIQPPSVYQARTLYSQAGLTRDNIHVIGMQALMDKQREKDIAAMGQNPDTYIGEIWVKHTVFDLPFEVLPYFIDAAGNETNDVYIEDSRHGDFVFFWLKNANTRKKGTVARTRRRRARSRSRSPGPPPPIEDDDDDGNGVVDMNDL